MSATRRVALAQVRPDAARVTRVSVRSGATGLSRAWLAALPVLLMAALAAQVGLLTRPSAAGAVADLSPAELTNHAADVLEGSIAGSGVTFDVVQRSWIAARADGPKIEIPDPTDRYKSLGFADTYELATYLARGTIRTDGFWSEIVEPTPGPDATPDPDPAPFELAALVRDGTTFRNDGRGWYETDQPPGIGLDPATAALLPSLLRNAAEPDEVDPEQLAEGLRAGQATRAVEATVAVDDIPGIIAPDLAASTELRGPGTFAFDAEGRLVGLTILARNTRLAEWDLLVETTITFAYPASAPELPQPEPRWDPANEPVEED